MLIFFTALTRILNYWPGRGISIEHRCVAHLYAIALCGGVLGLLDILFSFYRSEGCWKNFNNGGGE